MENIIYDTDKLNAVIKNFCIITNLSMMITDENFVEITSYSDEHAEFCFEIQKTEEGKRKCICSDFELMKKCRQSRHTETSICHAGVLDAAIPLIISDEIVGYIFIGRMRVAKFSEKCTEGLMLEKEKIKKLYNRMPKYSSSQVKSILELAQITVQFILTSNMVKPLYSDFAVYASDYIDRNLQKRLTVQELCKEFNVSKNMLYYEFRSAFGMTVNEYVMSKRIQTGRRLLETTDYTVSRISHEVGITSYTYFSRLFKEKYGISPLTFRKVSVR